MKKHRLIIGTEIALLIIIIFAFYMAVPALAETENIGTDFPLADVAGCYHDSIASVFNNAAEDIDDPQIAVFFDKYVSSMGLDQIGTISEADANSLSNLLPDIEKINKNALTLPLTEAATQLEDQELTEFYAGFLQKCGVE